MKLFDCAEDFCMLIILVEKFLLRKFCLLWKKSRTIKQWIYGTNLIQNNKIQIQTQRRQQEYTNRKTFGQNTRELISTKNLALDTKNDGGE